MSFSYSTRLTVPHTLGLGEQRGKQRGGAGKMEGSNSSAFEQSILLIS